MIGKTLLYTFIFFLAGIASTQAESFKKDSLSTILKNKGSATQKRDLILYLRYAFGDMPEKDLDVAREQTVQLLETYQVPDKAGLIQFVDGVCQVRRKDYSAAQNSLLKATEEASRYEDHYLLYACFTHLAFIYSHEGNVIEAISNFRAAKKEATIVDDAYLQIVIDVNLSDTYYRNVMLGQAVFYLDEAQSLMNAHHIDNERMQNGINNNKVEVFFQGQNIDSVHKYCRILNQAKKGTPGLYTFQRRAGYYLLFLQKRYAEVIQTINTLRADSLYQFKISDKRCLADAYFQTGMLDSARSVIGQLIHDTGGQNHAEVNLHLYKLLGDIDDKQGNYKAAADDYKSAFSQTWEEVKRLISVGSVSSQIRIDQAESSYTLRTETFKREKLWLSFIAVATTLTIIIGALLYYNVHRKKYYEKLLFESQKNEIAFINSHEVRRHASNIMGIMQMVHQAEHKYENFVESEEYLMNELNNLDTAIRNISKKLSS